VPLINSQFLTRLADVLNRPSNHHGFDHFRRSSTTRLGARCGCQKRSGDRQRFVRFDQLLKTGSFDPKLPTGWKKFGTIRVGFVCQAADHRLPLNCLFPCRIIYDDDA
tara:strand:- start:2488 stop:2811 length:324 start_codon:yes stop_codon:yes gene_type:complete